jgi:hypothetical protein
MLAENLRGRLQSRRFSYYHQVTEARKEINHEKYQRNENTSQVFCDYFPFSPKDIHHNLWKARILSCFPGALKFYLNHPSRPIFIVGGTCLPTRTFTPFNLFYPCTEVYMYVVST